MNFNTVEFAVFLPLTFLIYLALYRTDRIRDVYLLAISYFFYMSWYWQYAALIAFSSIVDYLVGGALYRTTDTTRRKVMLTVSVVINLGLLATFKYFNFFSENAALILTELGISVSQPTLDILLPVGISFYTFQTLSYTIDIYRGQLSPERDPIKFFVFVSFFPQLVAGPIVRARDFLPQLHKPLFITGDNVNRGMFLIFKGLIKKVVFADLFAVLAVDPIFSNPGTFSALDHYMALVAYAFQIYFDFSGYTDIAIGVALLFGFSLPINFNRPYLAISPSDFWERWHISLSSWLRDYLYISLGGNRLSKIKTLRNLLVTMILGGLWHGAGLNFIAWGAYHGALLIVFRVWQLPVPRTRIGIGLRQFLFFNLILGSWLLFRSSDLAHAGQYLTNFDGLYSTRLSPLLYALIIISAIGHWTSKVVIERHILNFLRTPYWIQSSAYTAVMLVLLSCSLGDPAFIYFQF